MLKIVLKEYSKKDSDSSRVNYDVNGQQLLPEQAALEHYKDKGYKGLWTENYYWWALFALLFWDVIFAKVKGAVSIRKGGITRELDPNYDEEFEAVFNQHFKLSDKPSDLFQPEFASNRADLIRNRYKELQNKNILEELEKKYKEHKGEKCRLIEDWDNFKLEELKEPLKYLNKEVFLRIILRLATDYNENRSGLPDLLVYKEDDFRFVEVKSEKDNISQAQIKWMAFIALDLGTNFDLFLINNSASKIAKIKDKLQILLHPIIIQLGKTSSSKREEMIELFKKQDDYQEKEEGISASFWIYDKNIKEILKTVGLWKTTRFFIGEKEYTVEQIRNVVYESYESKRFDIDEYNFWVDRETNYGCNKITIIYTNDLNWKGFGYIDTSKEKWIFDQNKITKAIKENLEQNVLCPYFDREKFKKDFLKLPKTIDPKEDNDWAFVDKDSFEWVYNNGKWLSRYGPQNFPSISSIVGVKRLTRKDKHEIFEQQQETTTPLREPEETSTSKKNNSKIIIVIIGIIALLFICCTCSAVLG